MDYERFGRQIALAELGVDGQAKLASRPVRFVGDPATVTLAERLWTHAGGVVNAPTHAGAADAVTVTLARVRAGDSIASLAAASWATLDATRAILGWPPRDVSPDLAALFGSDEAQEHTQS